MTFKLPEVGSVPSYIPPCAIVAPVSGKRYIVPWWIEIDDNEWQEQLELARKYYNDRVRPSKPEPSNKVEVKRWEVKNYVVSDYNGKWSCTCVGYQFRRDCKHIHHIRDGKPLEEKKPKKKK